MDLDRDHQAHRVYLNSRTARERGSSSVTAFDHCLSIYLFILVKTESRHVITVMQVL